MKISELYQPTFESSLLAVEPDVQKQAEEDHLKEVILANCGDALAVMKQIDKSLYRGMSGLRVKPFTGMPPVDRIPTTSDPKVQQAVDEILRAGGFNALRSNSIFCSSDIRQAKIYGHVFMILPYNGFDFTWSDTVHDLYDTPLHDFIRDSKKKLDPEKFLKVHGYHNDDFEKALKSGNEIMIHGKYIALPMSVNYNLINDLMRK
jgi:hypothetical protein